MWIGHSYLHKDLEPIRPEPIQVHTSRTQKKEPTHRIGQATITDEIGEDFSWVAVNLNDLDRSVLAGDMVRAVYADALAAGLGFGKCDSMLSVEIEPR